MVHCGKMASSNSLQLSCKIHEGLPLPKEVSADKVAYVKGDYEYYHYVCDDTDDRGWGCGYRTLQTLCSWSRFQLVEDRQNVNSVPSIRDIQKALVSMHDKPASHVGSRDWIGSVEVGLCVDYFYDIPCKIVHISSGAELHKYTDMLWQHFQTKGAPVMMGGDSDAASKGILGICSSDKTTYLLILDPHYRGSQPNQTTLVEHDMLLWRSLDWFQVQSFYNLCLPQHIAHSLR